MKLIIHIYQIIGAWHYLSLLERLDTTETPPKHSSRVTEEVDPDMWQVTIWLETQISAKFYSYNNDSTTVFRIFKFNVGVALVEEVPAPAWEQNNAWLQSATKMLGQLQLTHVQGV